MKVIAYFGGLLHFLRKALAKDADLVYSTFCRKTIATLAQLARARDL